MLRNRRTVDGSQCRSYDLWDWSNAVQSLRFWAESCFESQPPPPPPLLSPPQPSPTPNLQAPPGRPLVRYTPQSRSLGRARVELRVRAPTFGQGFVLGFSVSHYRCCNLLYCDALYDCCAAVV